MQLLEDRNGCRYALVKAGHEQSLVRDLTTGEATTRSNAGLQAVDSPVPDAGDIDPSTVRHPGAGELLAILAADGPLPVVTVMERTRLCESDVFAIRSELVEAGLLSERRVSGERRWELTAAARTMLDD